MGDNLHAASSQWATRPADERFWTLSDMHGACTRAREGSTVKRVPFGSLKATVGDEAKVLLEGPSGGKAHLTHYAFSQLARSVGAPAEYLRSLPAATAADCLNAGLTSRAARAIGDRDLLFHANGQLTLRAALSERYERVWDNDVCRYLAQLEGWLPPAGRTPPVEGVGSRPATAADILPGQINIGVGDLISPAGLYASDHDMFAFLVAPDRVISDGAGGALMRGIFVRNSEVGDASLSITFFLMQAVCGNHIVWGASGVHEVRVRHVGKAPLAKALRGFEAELRVYHDAAPEEERMIKAARTLELGTKKEDVLDAIIKYAKSHSLPISRHLLSDGYDTAEQHTAWYGSPNSLWGVVAGLTHVSQTSGFADGRNDTDRAAGKLLAMVDGF